MRLTRFVVALAAPSLVAALLACKGGSVTSGGDSGSAAGAPEVPEVPLDAAVDSSAPDAVAPEAGLEAGPGVQVCPSGATIPTTQSCMDAVDSGCSCVQVNADNTCNAFCRGNLGCPPPCE